MNISQLNFSLQNGDLEIYISGCNATGGCAKTCHAKFLWDFSSGDLWENWKERIAEEISYPIVKSVCILGGEPLDADINELKEFLSWIKSITNKKITLFTHYTLGFVIEKNLKNYVDIVKVGEYNPEQKITTTEFILQTGNQKFINLADYA